MFDQDAPKSCEAESLARQLLAWSEELAPAQLPGTHLLEEERSDLALGLAAAIKTIRRGFDLQYGKLNFGDPTFDELASRQQSFSAIAKYNFATLATVVNDEPLRIPMASVSRDFFDVLGVRPRAGSPNRPVNCGPYRIYACGPSAQMPGALQLRLSLRVFTTADSWL